MEPRQFIKVTQADLDAATRSDSRTCAVATAIARTLPDAQRITVDMLFVKLTEAGERYVFATPPVVQSYIIDFDAGESISPFNFRLDKRNRLIMQRNLTTPEGAALQAAAKKVRYRQKRAEALAADPAASPSERTTARHRAQEAQAELAAIRAAAGTKPRARQLPPPKPPTTDQSGDGVITRDRARSRKASVSHVREYGVRTMRINQARAERES